MSPIVFRTLSSVVRKTPRLHHLKISLAAKTPRVQSVGRLCRWDCFHKCSLFYLKYLHRFKRSIRMKKRSSVFQTNWTLPVCRLFNKLFRWTVDASAQMFTLNANKKIIKWDALPVTVEGACLILVFFTNQRVKRDGCSSVIEDK